MSSTRISSIAAGVMLIIATAAGVAAVGAFGSLLEGPDFSAGVAAHLDRIAAGATLEAVMGLACAGVSISVYPVLRRQTAGLAIGAVGFRLAEGVIYLVAAVAILAMASLLAAASAAGTLDAAGTRSAADLLRAVLDQCGVVGMLPFGLGALLYYMAFWRSRLVPRWLSGWGVVAIVATLAVVLLSMATRTDLDSFQVVMLPLMVQEMVLAAWLILKGFDETSMDTVKQLQLNGHLSAAPVA